MARVILLVLIPAFLNGIISVMSEESGPYVLAPETIEPRTYASDLLEYKAEIVNFEVEGSKSKTKEKRLLIQLYMKEEITDIGARITVWSDKSGSAKRGEWHEEAKFDMDRICDSPFGLDNFMDSLKPPENFQKSTCGFSMGNTRIENWTIKEDLKAPFPELPYKPFQIGVELCNKKDPNTSKKIFDEPFLSFKVTADIKKAHIKKKNKEKCKKDDEDCSNKKKKSDDEES